MATHPLSCMLEKMTGVQKVHGVTIGNKHMSGLGFADDTLLFIQACNVNVLNYMNLLDMYGDALDLHLDVSKSTLVDVSAQDFDSLLWPREWVPIGNIFRNLGYPLGVNVSNRDLINWALDKVKNKIEYWKAQEWPLHVHLRIVKAILIPYFAYYLPLPD